MEAAFEGREEWQPSRQQAVPHHPPVGRDRAVRHTYSLLYNLFSLFPLIYQNEKLKIHFEKIKSMAESVRIIILIDSRTCRKYDFNMAEESRR